MKLKLCGWPGCSNLVLEGYYCPKHKAIADQRKKDRKIFTGTKRDRSGSYHQLYNSVKWRKISKEFLAKYNVCVICGAKATIADHITPHRGNEDLFYDTNNLQPMCWSCHTRKTLAENNNFQGSKGDGGSKT